VCILQGHIYVITANVCFGLLAMFHLAYLGLMFDSSEEEEEVCSSFVLKCRLISSYARVGFILLKGLDRSFNEQDYKSYMSLIQK
jgi:hypothetical protein